MTLRRAAALGALAAACTLPPLRGRLEVAKDPYGVFVGEGSGGADLHVFHGTTGAVVPITFTPVAERAPALAPDGSAVLFLRAPSTVWVMNLLSGAERELVLPRGSAAAEQVAWDRGSRSAYVRAGTRTWRFAMPPGSPPVDVTRSAEADSAFMVLLGDPVFARVAPCGADTLCAVGRAGERSPLVDHVTSPARWGGDSVAWVRDGEIEVRPLGGGSPRTVELEPARQVTGGISYFGGR